LLTIKQTLFLVFGITSFIIFYVGVLNFLTIDTTIHDNVEFETFQKIEDIQKIILLDEITTNSLRNYAYTTDNSWKERFIENRQILDHMFEMTISTTNSYEVDIIAEKNMINSDLSRVEYGIIGLVDSKQVDSALIILDNGNYVELKQRFAFLNTAHITHVSHSLDLIIENNLEQDHRFQIHGQRVLLFSIIAAIGVGIGTLYISKKITDPIEKLETSIKNFTTHPITVEDNIDTSFKEFQNLSQDFQKMSKTIENTLALEKKLNLELHEIDREKNEFTAMISHELKTPLFPIKGYAQILKKEKLSGNLNPVQREAVNEIYESTKRLDKLIADILIAQKLEMGRLSFDKIDVLVSDLMQDQINSTKPLLTEKNIKLINTNNYNGTIFTDKYRISQIFTNLITNAVDFVNEKTGVIEIGCLDNKDTIIFYVKDNGSGIPQHQLNNLFKKFYQIDSSSKRSHYGSGLGLAICKGIIEGLNGNIWVESDLGKGTCFYFTVLKTPITITQKYSERSNG